MPTRAMFSIIKHSFFSPSLFLSSFSFISRIHQQLPILYVVALNVDTVVLVVDNSSIALTSCAFVWKREVMNKALMRHTIAAASRSFPSIDIRGFYLQLLSDSFSLLHKSRVRLISRFFSWAQNKCTEIVQYMYLSMCVCGTIWQLKWCSRLYCRLLER